MPQTMLALLALMIAMTLSFNTQREVIHSQREMIANELEVMATGIALRTMETIRTRAFDEAVVGDLYGMHATSSFEEAPFNTDGEPGHACKVFDAGGDTCDDIDDFHGLEATIPFEMDTLSIPFDVRVEVHYVGGDLSASGTKTYQKEVTVYVQDALSASARPFLTRPIHLSRVFAYGDQAHAGDSSEGWFEDFMGWFMDMLDDDDFKEWAVGQAEAQGWSRLVSMIQNENAPAIEQWFNTHPEVRDYIKAMWHDQISD